MYHFHCSVCPIVVFFDSVVPPLKFGFEILLLEVYVEKQNSFVREGKLITTVTTNTISRGMLDTFHKLIISLLNTKTKNIFL